jgi:hypothetical protein
MPEWRSYLWLTEIDESTLGGPRLADRIWQIQKCQLAKLGAPLRVNSVKFGPRNAESPHWASPVKPPQGEPLSVNTAAAGLAPDSQQEGLGHIGVSLTHRVAAQTKTM